MAGISPTLNTGFAPAPPPPVVAEQPAPAAMPAPVVKSSESDLTTTLNLLPAEVMEADQASSEPLVVDLSNKKVERAIVYESNQSQRQNQTSEVTDGTKKTSLVEESTSNQTDQDGEQEGGGTTEDGPPPTPPAMPNLSMLSNPFFSQGSGGSNSGIGSPFGGGGTNSSFSPARPSGLGALTYGAGTAGSPGTTGSPGRDTGAPSFPGLEVFGGGSRDGYEAFSGDFEPFVPSGLGPEAGGSVSPGFVTDSAGLLSGFAQQELQRMNDLAQGLASQFGGRSAGSGLLDDLIQGNLDIFA